MSLELGQPADGDQAVSADEAEETRSQEEATVPSAPAASDATSTYGDSGVPDTPDAPDDSDAADVTDTPESADVWDTSSTSGAADLPEPVDAWDASEESEDSEDSDATDIPDTPETTDAHEASEAEPLADPGAPGAAEPSVLDGATGGPAANGEEATDAMGAPVASTSPADEEEGIPVSGSGASTTTTGSAARLEEAAGDLDGPLLGDAAALRTNWQQILAGFVDDPREAVADAAGLVDHTAQALVGALQARQRLLRAMWDRDASPGDPGALGIGSPTGAHAAGASRADNALDTEELRLLIQRYRTLFNDICRS